MEDDDLETSDWMSYRIGMLLVLLPLVTAVGGGTAVVEAMVLVIFWNSVVIVTVLLGKYLSLVRYVSGGSLL